MILCVTLISWRTGSKHNMAERIAKFIASCGLCSRRQAEVLIAEGRVKVNGKAIDTPATLVDEQSIVEVDGKTLEKISATKIWILNKPTGYICTRKDEHGRPTIYDLLPADMAQVHYIGRLDINSEGLLLLTNSGEVKRFYEHPLNKIERVYLVRIFGQVPKDMFSKCARGVAIKDEKTNKNIVYHAKIENHKEGERGNNRWLKFTLKEGKNKEIRRICTYFGLEVSRLKRVSFGEFKLGSLDKAKFIEV